MLDEWVVDWLVDSTSVLDLTANQMPVEDMESRRGCLACIHFHYTEQNTMPDWGGVAFHGGVAEVERVEVSLFDNFPCVLEKRKE